MKLLDEEKRLLRRKEAARYLAETRGVRAAPQTPEKFVRRKKTAPNALAVEAVNNMDPAAQAALVAEAWGASVEAIIKTGVLVAEALRAFATDPDRLDAFIIELVRRGVLTEHEARRRQVAPKLVKLRTIGEHEKLLRQPRIFAFLVPSYTTLYHLTVVYRQLPEKDEQRRFEHLIKIMEGAPDEITREFLVDETAGLKQGRHAAPAIASPIEETADNADTAALVASPGQPQLVLMTPDGADETAIVMPYAPGDDLDERLVIMKDLRERDELAVILVTRVSVLPLIADRLLALCGFDCRHARYFLAQPPNSAEIGEENVIAVAVRGGLRIDTPGGWLDAADAVDPRMIAAKLYPGIASRLHMFSGSRAEGWKCLIGAENWSKG